MANFPVIGLLDIVVLFEIWTWEEGVAWDGLGIGHEDIDFVVTFLCLHG